MSPRTNKAGAARSTVGAGGKLRYLGRARNKLWFELTAEAYNLTRLANLEAAAALLNGAAAASNIGSSALDRARSHTGPASDPCLG